MMQSRATRGPPVSATARTLALVLIICLVQCTTEQRINSRGSKTNLVEKVNGWRSQRGGSCLSYGHSCWGAHGKRSGKLPASAPDWYLTRLLRKIVANGEQDIAKTANGNNEINAIYRVDAPDDSAENGKLMGNDDTSFEILSGKRNPGGIPMLDDDSKFWQMMKAESEEK